MEMTRLEKHFVNRESKGLANLERIERALECAADVNVRDVLEIGCGIGTVSAKLSEDHGWNVTGTDYDAAQVDLAKATYPQSSILKFQREDATALSFSDAKFDLVIAQNVFHHIPSWREVVTELARVLRPGGALIWYDIAVPGWVAALGKPAARIVSLYTRDEAGRAFASAGFELVREHREPRFIFHHYDVLFRRATRAQEGPIP